MLTPPHLPNLTPHLPGVVGLGCEDALMHLLNYVWPNVFETSPHVINAVMEAVEGLKCALGPLKILQYTLQVTCLVGGIGIAGLTRIST